jgi:centractin
MQVLSLQSTPLDFILLWYAYTKTLCDYLYLLQVVIGSRVGTAKHLRIMPGGSLEGLEHLSSGKHSSSVASYFIGKTLDDHRGAFLLHHPLHRGQVANGGWDAMELLLEHVYDKQNLNAKVEEHPLLLTEPPLNCTKHRQEMASLVFESFRSPALFLAPPAVLSLYASGRTTGIVLDVGHGLTHCIPVYEGYALPHSIVRSDLGGMDVDDRLKLLLRKGGLAFETTAEFEFCTKMKEEICYINPSNKTADAGANTAIAKAQYQLPDGQVIDISNERTAPEILFDPSIIGSEASSVQDVLLSSIDKSDLELRSTLYSNIVLSGGTTKTPGFGDRLLYEVRSRAPERTRIRISAPPEREHSAWVGGSILASLSTFKNMWVTKESYEEEGPDRVLFKGSL